MISPQNLAFRLLIRWNRTMKLPVILTIPRLQKPSVLATVRVYLRVSPCCKWGHQLNLFGRLPSQARQDIPCDNRLPHQKSLIKTPHLICSLLPLLSLFRDYMPLLEADVVKRASHLAAVVRAILLLHAPGPDAVGFKQLTHQISIVRQYAFRKVANQVPTGSPMSDCCVEDVERSEETVLRRRE